MCPRSGSVPLSGGGVRSGWRRGALAVPESVWGGVCGAWAKACGRSGRGSAPGALRGRDPFGVRAGAITEGARRTGGAGVGG